jgi:hypothetical protein
VQNKSLCVDFAISSALDRWSSFLTTAHQLDQEHTPNELASDKNILKAIAMNLLGKGIEIATIAEATGLTVLEITSFSQKGGDE